MICNTSKTTSDDGLEPGSVQIATGLLSRPVIHRVTKSMLLAGCLLAATSLSNAFAVDASALSSLQTPLAPPSKPIPAPESVQAPEPGVHTLAIVGLGFLIGSVFWRRRTPSHN